MSQIADTSTFPLLAHKAGFDPIEECLLGQSRNSVFLSTRRHYESDRLLNLLWRCSGSAFYAACAA